MANIPISQIETVADSLNNDDLILISKKNADSSYISARMRGSVLKSAVGSCQFTDQKVVTDCTTALTNYGASTLTSSNVQSACLTALNSKGVSTLTQNDVKTQCQSAISTVGLGGVFVDGQSIEMIELNAETSEQSTVSRTLTKNSLITAWFDFTSTSYATISLSCDSKVISKISYTKSTTSPYRDAETGPLTMYVKSGVEIVVNITANDGSAQGKVSICSVS